jgi:hypothetical protein
MLKLKQLVDIFECHESHATLSLLGADQTYCIRYVGIFEEGTFGCLEKLLRKVFRRATERCDGCHQRYMPSGRLQIYLVLLPMAWQRVERTRTTAKNAPGIMLVICIYVDTKNGSLHPLPFRERTP